MERDSFSIANSSPLIGISLDTGNKIYIIKITLILFLEEKLEKESYVFEQKWSNS